MASTPGPSPHVYGQRRAGPSGAVLPRFGATWDRWTRFYGGVTASGRGRRIGRFHRGGRPCGAGWNRRPYAVGFVKRTGGAFGRDRGKSVKTRPAGYAPGKPEWPNNRTIRRIRSADGVPSPPRTMLPVVHGSRIARLSTVAALLWLSAVPLPATADSCAVAVVGQGEGSTAVAWAGNGDCGAVTEPPSPPPPPPPPLHRRLRNPRHHRPSSEARTTAASGGTRSSAPAGARATPWPPHHAAPPLPLRRLPHHGRLHRPGRRSPPKPPPSPKPPVRTEPPRPRAVALPTYRNRPQAAAERAFAGLPDAAHHRPAVFAVAVLRPRSSR